MGCNKALLPIAGEPLVVRAARTLEPLVDWVNVIGSDAGLIELGLIAIPDDYRDCGPLGGIATALVHSECPWCLVVACDMPYLSREWLAYLIGRALESPADVVLPESAYIGEPLPEPLCALYHQRAAAPLRAALESGVRKVMGGLVGLRVERVPPEASKPFDTEGLLFQNLNSMQDYEAARERLETRR
jgi:molybdenum cofactor guanylyltransferase